MPRQKSTHVDDPTAVGRRLKDARERAGLSQRQLAFPGCSPAYISRIEAGERIPSLQLLRELGRRVGVTEDYLATGTKRAHYPDTFVEADVALRLDDLDVAAHLYDEALLGAADPATRARALEGLGQIALRRADPRRAVSLFEEALEAGGFNPCDRPGVAEGLGRAYATLGELAPAIAIFERCLEGFEQRGDKIQSIRFACLLGYALVDSGDFLTAERVIGKALAAGSAIADPYTRARLYWSQTKLRGEQGDAETASRYAYRALATLEATEDTYFIALAHQGIAEIELERGRTEEALAHLEQGRTLLDRCGTAIERAQFQVEEARALLRVGRREDAAALAMETSGLLSGASPIDAGRTYGLLAEVFHELGETARAQELYELAAELLERNNPNRHLVDVYSKLAELHEAEGRNEEAFHLMKKALNMQRAVAAKTRTLV